MNVDPKNHGRLEIFTDGACSGNPGPGGWAFLCRYWNEGHETIVEKAAGEPETTNNRMEMMAMIQAMEHLHAIASQFQEAQIWSDSQYVVKGLNEWANDWARNNWKKSDNKPVINADLWKKLVSLKGTLETITTIRISWVRGHAGNKDNERVDRLATVEARRFQQMGKPPKEG